MYLERTIETYIKKISSGFPVFLLTGMRQTGKSYILNKIKEHGRKYVSLDDLQIRKFAVEDPKGFIDVYQPPVIIDEIQYAPELFTYIKIYVDTHPKQKGLFWLTGSQRFHLMKGIRESLAGRVAIIDMLGLSYREIANRPDYKPFVPDFNLAGSKNKFAGLNAIDVFTNIWKGSYPGFITDSSVDRDAFYRSYLRTYIERDISDDIGIKNELQYYDFIRAAASRTGGLLNYSNLSADVDINVRTAKKWMEALVRSGLVYILEPYTPNINRRIANTPKIYFMDTGLAAYLTKWDSPETLMNGAFNGAVLETYVFCEIMKSYWHNGNEESIYFYRENERKEIDFIIERNNTLYPIEVKKTASPDVSDFKNFSLLENFKSKQTGTGAVICMYPEAMPIGKNVLSVPVWEI
ncbi:MAG: ATP-binding protein [Endomicrobium sp.]|jgi:predicted AAA+ superfamily ATPase|nr:ATP-binding protein [Endomicrobium sp.]